MGSVIVINGANFTNARSRKIDMQPIEIETVYEQVYFLNNGKLRPFDSSKTAGDYPAIHGAAIDGDAAWSIDYAVSQVEIPEGAIAICGISNTIMYVPSNNQQFNGMPICFANASGSILTTGYGKSWLTANNKNSVLADADFESVNTEDGRMYDTLKVVARAEGVSTSNNSVVRLIKLVVPVHPDAKYVNLTWFLPKSVTTVASQAGGSSVGVGIKKPKLFWVYE